MPIIHCHHCIYIIGGWGKLGIFGKNVFILQFIPLHLYLFIYLCIKIIIYEYKKHRTNYFKVQNKGKT